MKRNTENPQTEWLGWYWLPQPAADGKLYLNNVPDSPETEIFPGATHRVEGPVETCVHGLHASERALDALAFADSWMVARVRLNGEMDHDSEKSCATERTILWIVDAQTVLREFACDVAEEALKACREAGDEPHPDSWRAIEVARRHARGEATDEELAAARAAARAAAWDAAWDAAWAAARAAARAAAWDAAWAAARAAAWDAAWAAAWDAARAAAWDAARAAARDAQNNRLEQMLLALHESATPTETP